MIRRKIEGKDLFIICMQKHYDWMECLIKGIKIIYVCIQKHNIDNIWIHYIHTLYLKPVTFYNHRYSRLHKNVQIINKIIRIILIHVHT